MNFLKTMDIYKGIVLVSVILLPLAGWWVSGLDTEISKSRYALRSATKSGGWLEQIGALQKKIEIVAQNRRTTSEAIENPSTYFEGQIMAVSQNLRANDFTPGSSRPANSKVGKQQVVDHAVDISWAKGEAQKKFQMDFVYAVLFNCESGARRGMDANGSPSVWRLSKLTLENATGSAALRGKKVPDPEMQDAWLITTMQFARREPKVN